MASDSKDTRVHRLTSMDIEEVSLVDRAANQTTFLILKQKDGNMAREVFALADGSFTTGEQKAAPPIPPQAPPAMPPQEEEAPQEAAPSGLKLTKAAKEACAKVLSEIEKMCGAAHKAVLGAEEVEDESMMDVGVLAEPCMACAEQLEDLVTALVGTEKSENALPFNARLAARSARRVLETIEVEKSATTLVEKVGRRMKKERFIRMESALNTLVELLGELRGEEGLEAQKASKKPGTMVAPAVKSQPDLELERRLAEQAIALKNMTAELATLRKSSATSNAQIVESLDKPKGAKEAYWPQDLNR